MPRLHINFVMSNFEFIQIKSVNEFENACFKTFDYQYRNNQILKQYVNLVGGNPNPKSLEEITFLPIEFFKSKEVITGSFTPEITFTSSSTTGVGVSNHHLRCITNYKKSFNTCFNNFYGNISNYLFLALLPSYLERSGSSLIYMAENLIKSSQYEESGFFLDEFESLDTKLKWAEKNNIPTILLGVTFGLLDFAEAFPQQLNSTLVMETGGMKGRKKEMTREEVHKELSTNLGVDKIHSEYGMTELLSQAYSSADGIFNCPPWMKVVIRDTSDPLSQLGSNKTGGINIIDLANQDSCSFIATQDLGTVNQLGQFEVLGRFDNSDIRGCNLLAV